MRTGGAVYHRRVGHERLSVPVATRPTGPAPPRCAGPASRLPAQDGTSADRPGRNPFRLGSPRYRERNRGLRTGSSSTGWGIPPRSCPSLTRGQPSLRCRGSPDPARSGLRIRRGRGRGRVPRGTRPAAACARQPRARVLFGAASLAICTGPVAAYKGLGACTPETRKGESRYSFRSAGLPIEPRPRGLTLEAGRTGLTGTRSAPYAVTSSSRV